MKVFALSVFALSIALSARAEVDYVKEIKPIFARNCWKCHGAVQQKGGLRLDTASLARKGGELGAALTPGNVSNSMLVQAIEGTHPKLPRMPYKRESLSSEQIALIKEWIAQGANAPADEKPTDPSSNLYKHWSFIPPVRPEEPAVKNSGWVKNAIDKFVLSALERQNIQPSPEADRVTLIRRLFLDLTGLPPTPEEVEAFVSEKDPRAYEKLVEHLLASPHYGEKWARHWLDMARYADSNGYSIDSPRSMWKYREWVINAFNSDMPFDQFTIEQIAGDLLPNPTLDQKIATGFHRNTMINEEGGIDKEQFRIESVLDRVNTTGSVWLGLTVGCAQCHDHKFDPIKQKDYYQLYAFLNNADEPTIDVGTKEQLTLKENIRAQIAELQKQKKEIESVRANDFRDWLKNLSPEAIKKERADIRKILNVEESKRTEKQKTALEDYFFSRDEEFKKLKDEIAKLQKDEPKLPTTFVMEERREPRESYLFIKGDFTRKGEIVRPDVPASLPPIKHQSGKTTRLDLARWLVAPENPLTARVTVNRIWAQYFGKGIVETDNDFGTQGAAPTNPELLDWLATEFIRQNWSMKAMHRLIVSSAAYRQSSNARPDLDLKDPNNKLLARQNRFRLDAEVVRDAALKTSGVLNEEIGGPSVFPPQPDGVMTLGQSRREWKTSPAPEKYRRGLYTFFWRATPHPSLTVFDAPDGTSACTRRIRSNTPLQSLTLLNDAAYFELARKLADRIVAECSGSTSERIRLAFRLCLSREPKENELGLLNNLFAGERESFAKNIEEAEEISGSKKSNLSPAENAAWVTVARVMLNLDEAITRE